MGGIAGGGGGGLGGILGGGSSSLFGSSDANEASKKAIRKIEELETARATDGAPMPRVCGRRAPLIPGTILYQSKIDVDEDTEKAGAGKSSSSATVLRYSVTVVISWGQAFAGTNGTGRLNSIKKILANGKSVWIASDPEKEEDRYESLTNYEGGSSQGPDPVLEGILGSGKVSGFRDTSLTVIEKLDLADWGNQPPGVWEAIVQPDDHSGGTPYTIRDALTDVFLRAPDRVVGEIHVADVSGANTIRNGDAPEIVADGQFEGLRIDGLYSTADVLQMIADVYDLVLREDNGVLKFLDRGDEPIVHVLEADMGAAEGKAGTERPIQLTPRDHSNLPTEAVLQFHSKRNGFRRDSMRKMNGLANNATDGTSVVSLDVPMLLPQSGARRIAKRMLYTLRREAFDARVVLPPKYLRIQETDIVGVPDPSGSDRYYIKAEVVTIGANYMIEVEGPVLDIRNKADALLTSIPSTITGDIEDDDVDAEDEADVETENADLDDYAPPGMAVSIADMPAITEEETTLVGFFYSHCAEDPKAPFKSVTVFKGPTTTGPWTPALTSKLKHELPLGSLIHSVAATTALPLAIGDGIGVDNVNWVDVQMIHGTLQAQTIAEFWFEPAYFLVGAREVLAARTVTPLSPITITPASSSCDAANQITRGAGDWVTDGIWAGMYVRMTGWATSGNNSFRRVTFVTGPTITVAGPAMTVENAVAGVVFVFNESNCYRLTDISRGLRDTRDHINNETLPNSLPIAGDRVVPLRGPWLEWINITKGKVGKDKFLRIVPKGKTVAEVPSIQLEVGGETVRPFRPSHMHWLWDSSTGDDEPVLRWLHRTRSPEDDPTAKTIHDLIDSHETYELQIADADDFPDQVVRTEIIKFSNHEQNRVCAWKYTLAKMVTADGFTEGAGFWWRVRQRGSIVTDGNWTASVQVLAKASYEPPTGGLAAHKAETK